MNTEFFPCILTIAGSDSGGGAGIQADLKTITVLGGYGLSVLTALTAQNTLGVQGIHPAPAVFVRQQMDSVITDFPVRAAKTGMLFSEEIIKAVSRGLEGVSFPVVVDPVCVSQSGDRLLEDGAVKAFKEEMIPKADVLTPNRPEAELLTGLKISNAEEISRAAEILLDMGARAVLLKGGHFESERMCDWLFVPDKKPVCLEKEKIFTGNTHGTGCTLSAALATYLGRGINIQNAVIRAKDFVHMSLRASFPLGSGQGPVNHLAFQLNSRECSGIIKKLENARDDLCQNTKISKLVPEVGMNLAHALPFPETFEHVAAFDGRIRRTKSGRLLFGCPSFGSSTHMAKVLLSARKLNVKINCVANIRFNTDILEAVERLNLVTAWFDRAQEPQEIKNREGSTLEWGTLEALKNHQSPELVRVIADRGEAGKEPMLRILGEDTLEVIEILRAIAELV
ncbi:MAG: bifunctional hydroxymethylpyrimidine kinase/phosphomethylpyrimidine kinase [Desulfovibrionales bacterium]